MKTSAANLAQHPDDFLGLGFAERRDLKHLGAAVGRVFLTFHESFGGEQINHADEGGAFDAQFLGQNALADPFAAARQNAQRMRGGFRQTVRRQRLIHLAAPDPRQPQDQQAEFCLNEGL